MTDASRYRGRFAPSPSGPLHQGSLLAAVAGYLDAKAEGGKWLLRIEDIDPPREIAGAADRILHSLEAHALHWDETPVYQSERTEAYLDALEALNQSGRLFRCCCTRSTLGPAGSCGRRCSPAASDSCSLRFDVGVSAGFADRLLGQQPGLKTGTDIVLKRKDGFFAYALAVVVDDAWQNITHVVRGRDLLHQTSAQRELMRQLGHPTPSYAHHPIICDAQGDKLSKQAGAPEVDDHRAIENLREVLRVLGQESADMPAGSAQELLSLATELWNHAPLVHKPLAHDIYRGTTTP
ncbi:MAG: tRNA glutamyl-Q(34) synthetase GluQRS [Congregibacter sp.]